MTNDEINQAVCKARGEAPTVTWRMMNEAESGYSIEFDTMREINMWEIKHPEICRDEHIVKWETWRKYSEDIRAAWKLVEEMQITGFWVQLRTPFVEGMNNDYWCGVTPKGVTGWNGEPDNWTQSDTAPRAICLVWLKWKAVQG